MEKTLKYIDYALIQHFAPICFMLQKLSGNETNISSTRFSESNERKERKICYGASFVVQLHRRYDIMWG